ncbi:MAG: hypothetical protein LBC53_03770 [Spirochaetaceae bacterium]|jgi:hypothetical protein|nr:hypothetical protein [Spirochaetaceae bacterium]
MKKTIFILFAVLQCSLVFGQTNTSIPLNDPVYQFLEICELRGLCQPLPKVKPYTLKTILGALTQIENADGRFLLTQNERIIIQRARERLNNKKTGFNPQNGLYRIETNNQEGLRISAEAGVAAETTLSGGFYLKDSLFGSGFEPGLDFWLSFHVVGDIGDNFSYYIGISGGLMYANRNYLGKNFLYYDGYEEGKKDETKNVYTQPRAFFPYGYKAKWDGVVWEIPNINNADFLAWPVDFSIGYGTTSEIAGTFLSDSIFYRVGRLPREYGGIFHGYSLDLNAAAQPFFGVDLTISPFNWIAISSLTGVLEFYSEEGIKASAYGFQNMYTISQIELMYKNYIHFGFGSAVVWPKRFELGYILPIIDKHFYQMAIGDFDNTAEFANLKLQAPGVGAVWASLFLDEINPEPGIFQLDRALYAFQFGAVVNTPFLPFGKLELSYTKIEPYVYTHPKIETPWYSDRLMEQAFLNHGDMLGYYLKPNSDEIKAKISFAPAARLLANAQYQLIRHGAEFGDLQVDGSSGLSELGDDRSKDPHYRKFFLRDGAYEWNHIIKFGVNWEAPRTAIQIFAETGVSIQYFTAITEGKPNDGSPHPYKISKTYPSSSAIFLTAGVRVFNR